MPASTAHPGESVLTIFDEYGSIARPNSILYNAGALGNKNVTSAAKRPTELVGSSNLSLGAGLFGSLTLHGLAMGVALATLSSNWPTLEEPELTSIMVYVEPNAPPVAIVSERTLGPNRLPANPIPPLEEPPPLDLKTATPDLPAPPELPPPPDFRPPPTPTPPAKPAQSSPKPKLPQPSVATTTNPPANEPAPDFTTAPSVTASVTRGWNALLAAWLAAHKSYPEIARKRNESGEVTLHFTVASDGRVMDVGVVVASGSADLDEAALSMLRGATLPPPGAEATRTVRIRYRLSE
jgi:TonB family protein